MMARTTKTCIVIDADKLELSKMRGLKLSRLLDEKLNEVLGVDGGVSAVELVVRERNKRIEAEIRRLEQDRKALLERERLRKKREEEDLRLIKSEVQSYLGFLRRGAVYPKAERLRVLNKKLENKIKMGKFIELLDDAVKKKRVK